MYYPMYFDPTYLLVIVGVLLCMLASARVRTTYAKYENGELNVKISVLLELKKLYNCSFDAFFEDLEEPK